MSTSKESDLATLENTTDQLLIRLREEYDCADKFCKSVEEFRDEAGIPPINELRYAGFHLLNAVTLVNNNIQSQRDHLTSAINHCRRASYEAGEAGILTALAMVDLFKDDYSTVVVSDVIPEWVTILKRCDEIKDQISDARQTGDDRSNDHEVYMDAFVELKGFCKTLKYSRDEMNKKIAESQRQTRNFLWGTLIALFGIILAIVFGVLPYFVSK